MHIRPATEEDAPAISALNADVQEIHAQAVPHLFKPPSPETFPPARIAELMADPDNYFFLALEGQEPAGYVYAQIRHLAENSFHYRFDLVHVDQISVRPAHRERGCGTGLLQAVRSLAREKGIETVALDVWTFNTDAFAFFASQGFQCFNERMWMRVDDGEGSR